MAGTWNESEESYHGSTLLRDYERIKAKTEIRRIDKSDYVTMITENSVKHIITDVKARSRRVPNGTHWGVKGIGN